MTTNDDALQFNLLGEPPTRAQIEAERVRLDAAIRADERRSNRHAIALVAAGAGLALWAGFSTKWELGATVLVLFLGIGFAFLGRDSKWTELATALCGLRTITSADQAQVVVDACERDARVDAYRRKVVEQGRDLVEAECTACAQWTQQGLAADRAWALIKSDQAILAAPARGK